MAIDRSNNANTIPRIRELLDQGNYDLNCTKVRNGMSAVMYAAFAGSKEALLEILKSLPNVEQSDSLGRNSLHLACCSGKHKRRCHKLAPHEVKHKQPS